MWCIENKAGLEGRKLNDRAAHPKERFGRDLDPRFEAGGTESCGIMGTKIWFSFLPNHTCERFLYLDDVVFDIVLKLVHRKLLDLWQDLEDIEIVTDGVRDGGFDGHKFVFWYLFLCG